MLADRRTGPPPGRTLSTNTPTNSPHPQHQQPTAQPAPSAPTAQRPARTNSPLHSPHPQHQQPTAQPAPSAPTAQRPARTNSPLHSPHPQHQQPNEQPAPTAHCTARTLSTNTPTNSRTLSTNTPPPARTLTLLLLLATTLGQVLAQAALEGRVTDEDGTPVAYANLYFPELGTGTSTDDGGAYFLRLPTRGDYQVAVSALGYLTRNDTIVVGDATARYDFSLEPSAAALDEIIVRASTRDPAYRIIAEASARRRARLRALDSYRVEVYLKAREDVETFETPRQRRRRERREARGDTARTQAPAPVATVDTAPRDEAALAEATGAARPGDDSLLTRLNLVESRLTLNYQAPRSYKEQRHAYKVSGSKDGLLVPLFGDGDFDFYRAQVDFGSLAESPLVSPLAPAAVLTYKFRHIATHAEGPELVHEIAIEPRRHGNAALEGRIWINDGTFVINRVDVTLPGGGLRLLDRLRFEQAYTRVGDSTWLPARQVFTYSTRDGRRRRYDGQTTVRFSDYALGVAFPQNFFRGELAVTGAEAYKRDSSYWAQARVEPLAADEAMVVHLRDSIRARQSSPAYQDSVQAAFNRVQLLEVVWDGVGFRRWRRREQLYFGSLPAWLSFTVVGGFRVGPYVEYARRFANGQQLFTSVSGSVGLSDGDALGSYGIRYRYGPRRLAQIDLDLDRAYESINPYDAILNQLQRSNYFLVNRGQLRHRIELVNGLYAETAVGFAERRPAPAIGTGTILGEIIDDEAPVEFEPYDALITDVGFSFTPFQRYLSEPTQKVVLGSAWPTLRVRHRRGWDGLLGSGVDFDYLEASVSQSLTLGAAGNTRYRAWAGTFVNTRDLPFIDVKRFPRSNRLLFSAPLNSFQLLDTALETTRPFFEFHALHHFNGAFLNNLPLIRLTGVELVAGGGVLWLTERGGYRHAEALVGLERVFKLGARRRLRLGVYGVVGDSDAFRGSREIKFSLDVIDTWKKDWSF